MKIPRHWPLTAADIIQERVNFEDRILHTRDSVPELPTDYPKPLKLTPTAALVMGRQMFIRGISLLANP